MNCVFTLPPGYTVSYARNKADRWATYRLLILHYIPLPILIGFAFSPVVIVIMILMLSLPLQMIPSPILATVSVFGVLHFIISNELFSSNRRVAIALYGERIIGCALLAIREDHSVLLRLYVLPEHRHQGIGSSLIQYILRNTVLPIHLNAPTAKLRSFYAQLGFAKSRIRRGFNMAIQAQLPKK